VFRRDLGNLSEAYAEVAKRLGILPEGTSKPSRGPKLVH
jgi:phosphoribosylaminoimidazole-succinocarboxamide synthase